MKKTKKPIKRFPWEKTAFGHVLYTLVCSQEQLNAVMGNKSEVFLDGAAGRCSFYDGKDNTGMAIVHIDPLKDVLRVQTYGLIVHEAVHVYQRTVESMGEDSPSVEFEAYQIQAIAQRLMEMYEEYVLSLCGDKKEEKSKK